jgi:hypothetical protein
MEEVLHLIADKKQNEEGSGYQAQLSKLSSSDPFPPARPTYSSFHHLPKIVPPAGDQAFNTVVGDISYSNYKFFTLLNLCFSQH